MHFELTSELLRSTIEIFFCFALYRYQHASENARHVADGLKVRTIIRFKLNMRVSS